MNGQSISCVAADTLRYFGYRCDDSPSSADLRFRIRTRSGASWRSQILVDDQARIVRFCVFLDVFDPAVKRGDLIELILRLNEALAIGSFQYQFPTHAVLYYNGVDYRDVRVTKKVVGHLLNDSAFALDLFERAYGLAVLRKAKPSAIVEAALAQADVVPISDISPEARKALLHVATGGPVPNLVATMDAILAEIEAGP